MNRRIFIKSVGIFSAAIMVKPEAVTVISAPIAETSGVMYLTGYCEYDVVYSYTINKLINNKSMHKNMAKVINMSTKPLPKVKRFIHKNYQARRA